MQDSQPITANHLGTPAAVQALVTGQARPLSSTSADIDEDGVSDLLVGYSALGGGVIAVHRGNLDAFAPQSHESWQAIAEGRFPTPFLPDAQVFSVPVRPDFLAAGNFTGSGHLDLVLASRGGNALYVFSSDGAGKFSRPQVINLPGGITALAAGQLGSSSPFTNLIVGVSSPKGSSLSVYRGARQGLTQLASYPLTAPASAVAFGDLDGDHHPDAAVLSGGQVQILHSSSLQLETISLPVSAVSMALGTFIHDRGLRLQVALLTSDGSIHIAARGGFDPRAFTADEARAMRLASLRGQPNPVVPARSAAVNESWQIVESFASLAPFSDSAGLPVLLRTRISSHATDDVMVFNRAANQMAVISHANVPADAATFVPGAVSIRAYAGSPIAAVSARVNADARPGVILLHEGQVTPFVMMPVPDPTFTVNTTADTVTANGCAPGNPNTCSLREAIIEANASAGADTIMVPAGTYQLTIAPAGGADPHDATTGDLDITDGVSIIGANSATTIVEAGASAGSGIDKLFSINPLGAGAGFDTSISNLTVRFGKNPFASGTGDQFGGALDWSAGFDGAGNLTLTSCIITQNATTDGDGGGIALSNPGGSGTVTITNSTFSGNAANTSTTGNGGVGGGILVGSFTSVTMTNSFVMNNLATQTTGAQGKGGGINLGAFSHTSIHHTQISSNQAAGDGGGIWTNQGLTIDQGSIISLNTAGGNGGGIWSDNQDIDITALSKITITGNSATGTGGGIHVDASSPQVLNINFSRIVLNAAAAGSGFDNINGTVDATDNWWGCNLGPSSAPCNTVNDPNLLVTFDPWIVLSHTPNPAIILLNGNSTLTASFLQDNHGAAISAANLPALIGIAILFNNPVLGTLSNLQTTIQPSGTATATFTANAIGAGHADATVDSQTVTANITINPGSATHFAVAAPASVTAGLAFSFTVMALDTNNNIATGYAGIVHFTSTDGAAVLPANSTLTNGAGTFVATLKTAGNRTITATDTVTASITGTSNTIAVSPAATTHFAVAAQVSVVINTAFNFTVTAQDQFNNTTTGYAGTAHFTSSDALAVLPVDSTLTNGVGTFSATLKTAGNQTITATDTVTPAITGTSTIAVIQAGQILTITPLAGSANVTVSQGDTATFVFTVTAGVPQGTISFACSGAPAGTLPGSGSVMMNITTFRPRSSLVWPLGGPGRDPWYVVLLLSVLGLAAAGLSKQNRRKAALRPALSQPGIMGQPGVLVLSAMLLLLALSGCGGTPNQGGTTPGTYSVTVTGTSSLSQASSTVTLTVQHR